MKTKITIEYNQARLTLVPEDEWEKQALLMFSGASLGGAGVQLHEKDSPYHNSDPAELVTGLSITGHPKVESPQESNQYP
jgi:hypothetical protein